MAQPVWVLSVDLQTKTATFKSGMADAAKAARSAFTDIKAGSASMSSSVGGHMFASRHAVMALSESFGETMPRAITALLVHIGPLGAALEAAFPFAAIALGAVLLIEHLEKMKEAGIKLTEDQVRFGTAVQNAFNQLDQEIVRAEIKSDELRNDHLGALHLQLKLIDAQSLDKLAESFAHVAKEADSVFAGLKTKWFQFGEGSTGAKNALDEFQVKYEALLSKGADKEAGDLLRGTLDTAKKVLQFQNDANAVQKPTADSGGEGFDELVRKQVALVELRKKGIDFDTKEIASQQELVRILESQLGAESRVAELKKLDKGNASAETGKGLSSTQAEGAREAAEHAQKMGELSIDIERSTANAQMAVRAASVADRLASDLHFADEELAIQTGGNAALIAALNKSGNDYNNELKGLQEKGEELTRQHEATVAALKAKAAEQQYREDIQALEGAERDKIEATMQGSAARIAAISAALKEEAAKNLQATDSYRSLLKERIEAQRQYDEEAAKLTAEAGKEQADFEQKMGELALAAERGKQALMDSLRRVTIQQRAAEEAKAANAEYQLKMKAIQQEIAALDKGGKDYLNHLKALQNKEVQMVREHENEVSRIQEQAEIERNDKIKAAQDHFNDTIASGLTEVLMGHKSFASMMDSIGNQVVSGMMKNAIESALANDFTKESDAAKAARDAYNAGMKFPWPANIAIAPVLGAAAFAAQMAFADGTDSVPGVGRGDTVPAMLSPGEGVVPGGVMDGLRTMARNGQLTGGNHYHAHVSPVYNVQAVDASGFEAVLQKHSATLNRHVSKEIRRMNK